MKIYFKILLVLTMVFMLCSCNKGKENIINPILEDKKNTSKDISENGIDYLLPTSTTNEIIYHAFFTLSYSEKYEQSEWVAYELRKDQLSHSNFKRPYFIDDPEVATGSASYRNYKKSGYDKGHLCPAGDRKFSKKAFEETFYTSNISPQLNEFNAGIWNTLEGKTRYWAEKYDGIYVITGGVLCDNLETIGDEDVAVPKYFYKILLDKSRNDYKVIAFLLPHKASKKPLYDFVVSVDEIEKITGIDFFPNLSNDIENNLEKKSDYKDWSF